MEIFWLDSPQDSEEMFDFPYDSAEFLYEVVQHLSTLQALCSRGSSRAAECDFSAASKTSECDVSLSEISYPNYYQYENMGPKN
jgi:hypothetical protein